MSENTHNYVGLTEEEAAQRLKQVGLNNIPEQNPILGWNF